jgi:hypothetical protein
MDCDQAERGDEPTRVSLVLHFAIPRAKTREQIIDHFSQASEVQFPRKEHQPCKAIYLFHNDISETIVLYGYK